MNPAATLRFAAAVALLLLAWPAMSAPALKVIDERTLTARDGTMFTATRAVVVPERREHLDGPRIQLAVVRVSKGAGNGAAAHAILAGGPGDSGVDEVLNLATLGGAAWFDLMAGDVIGIDQRGTGGSRPSLASSVRYDLPLDQPGSPDAWLPIMAAAARREASRLKREGIDLGAYNTEESADDVEAVRRAFGYGPLVLWGRSYGSHLALATLRRHPASVARLILVSPEGPDHTWKLPGEAEAVLERIAMRADAPDLLGNMRKVLSDLRERPISVSVETPEGRRTIAIGAFDVQFVLAQALGDPRAIAGLPASFRMMAAGDYRAFAPIVHRLRANMTVQSAMKHAMDLSSGASASRRALIEGATTQSMLGNALNFPTYHLADAWQVAELPPRFREPVRSAVPALILVGDLDIRTPVTNAKTIAATLPNAQVVVAENAAHQFNLFGDAQMRAALRAFLAGRAPERNVVTLPPLPYQR